MTEYPTRRALREAERRGESTVLLGPSASEQVQPKVSLTSVSDAQPMTRRQLRNQEAGRTTAIIEPQKASPAVIETPRQASAQANILSRRQMREQVPAPLEAPEIEVTAVDFTGQNLLAEPTTAAIVLDRAPEAIEMPIETGEVTITGSIQVITGPITGPSTATVDNVSFDDELEQGAVTGVISTVEPISALELIGERSATGVVPNSVLRKGWWKPLVLAIAAIALAVATIWASLTILGAGG